MFSQTHRYHINASKDKLGFTLIELLVTVSIILLTTGAGIAGFINFNDKQQVQTTVKDVQELMRSAQIKARAGEGANDCGVNNKLKGYQVITGTSVVILNRICVFAATGGVSSTTERSRVTLDGTTVSFSPSNGVTFFTLKGGVDTGGSDLTVTVAGEYSSIEYEFQVLQTGEVTEGAFN